MARFELDRTGKDRDTIYDIDIPVIDSRTGKVRMARADKIVLKLDVSFGRFEDEFDFSVVLVDDVEMSRSEGIENEDYEIDETLLEEHLNMYSDEVQELASRIFDEMVRHESYVAEVKASVRL